MKKSLMYSISLFVGIGIIGAVVSACSGNNNESKESEATTEEVEGSSQPESSAIPEDKETETVAEEEPASSVSFFDFPSFSLPRFLF